MQNQRSAGQSLVEYVVLLALVTIVAVSLVVGLGQRSSSRVAQASDAMSEASVASSTDGKGKPPGIGIAGDHNGKPKTKKNIFGD